MKRSKLFLGVTTFLLAVAGIAAAKRFGPVVARWYCTIGNGSIKYCIPVAETCVTKLTGFNLKTCTVHFGVPQRHVPIYLIGALTIFENVVTAKPCDSITNCITPIKYTRNN